MSSNPRETSETNQKEGTRLQKLGFGSLSPSGVHFSPTPPKFEGLYLSAQMELCDTSHNFYSGNMMNFRFVTLLGMFEELKILPEQKDFFSSKNRL